jgi:hypothetical protein
MRIDYDKDQLSYALANALKERDEAREERDKMQTELEMWRDGNIMHQIHRDELEKTGRERDEARKESEEQARLIGMSAEREESLRGKLFMLERELAGLKEAAKAVVNRWELPSWKDSEPTAVVIYKLRDTLNLED